MRNSWPRRALAVAAVLLLSVPSAVGVQRALEPTRGTVASWLAAAGFEAVYLAVALLVLTPDLRRYAHRVAVAAVATAISLNALADYSARVPDGLASWAMAQQLFDPLALALAVAESVPLAALAFAMANLLHRLAEAEAPEGQPTEGPALEAPAVVGPLPDLALARQGSFPVPFEVLPFEVDTDPPTEVDPFTGAGATAYHCPRCNAPLPSAAHAGAARRWNRCPACKDR